MAQEYRYCWLKMVEVTDQDPVRQGTTPTGLAAWSEKSNALKTFVGFPPYQAAGTLSKIPDPAPNAFPSQAIVFSGCKPCPAVAPQDRYAAAELAPIGMMTPPPEPENESPLEGWQIEGTSLAGAIGGDQPKVFFACRPVKGTRAEAVAWLAGTEGQDWLKDSSTCVLMSYFRPAPN